MTGSTHSPHPARRKWPCDRLARRVLASFLLTFVGSRIVVFLIMSKRMPNLFFFVHGTHVHHLNYGIFLLSVLCGYVLFRRPTGREEECAAVLYGFSLGLTFDEFGMWLHLGGSYWQRESVDMVIIVAALFGLIAYARCLERLEARHFRVFLVLIVALIGFGVAVYATGCHLGDIYGEDLISLEQSCSP